MTRELETLTELVSARVGVPGGMTYDAFQERAIDPVSRHNPSRGVLWKIAKGEPIMVSPEVVRAVAAALDLPPARVVAAAAYQYTGLIASDVAGGLVLHDPAVDPETPEAQKAVREQRDREGE